jgi:hypothetical protein
VHSQFVVTTVSPTASLPLPASVLLVDDGAAVGCSSGIFGQQECVRLAFDPEFFPDPPDLLSGPRIVWSGRRSTDTRSPVIGAVLDDFIRLADGRPDQVAAFARRWGVLGFDDKNWTPDLRRMSDPPGDRCHLEVRASADGRATAVCNRESRWAALADGSPDERQRILNETFRPYRDWYWEPVVMWQEYSRGFRAVLRLAGIVGEQQHIELADIAAARRFRRLLIDCEGCGGCDECEGTKDDAFRSVEACRELLIELTNQLLAFGEFYPRLTWDPDDGAPSVVMNLSEGEEYADLPPYGFLFPALVSRLCATLASPLGIYQCDACGSPYSPLKRRPRADRRRYCPPCSLEASLASKREWWRRNRAPGAHARKQQAEEETRGRQ